MGSMRRLFHLFAAASWVAAAIVAAGAAPQAPQGQGFRSTADVVPVFATVRDKAGRLVPNLTREDFEILDNGKPQALTLFDNSPQPVRLIALLDFSGSMSRNVPLLRRATLELIKQLGPDDLLRVGTFGEDINLTPEFTRQADVSRRFPSFIPVQAPTPLWRAVDQAMTEFVKSPPGRRVVMVLSDGKDSGFEPGKRFVTSVEVANRAVAEEVMIYAIGMRSAPAEISPGGIQPLASRLSSDLPDPALAIIASETGGGYIELRPRDNLAEAFGRVLDELHGQYLLGFAPPARDGKTHKVEVRTKDRAFEVQARKAYIATNRNK
jgi:Ca-activated chloride channel homolog